jgi:hypothetical protein
MTMRWWHWLIPPAALLFQALPPLFIRYLPGLFYGEAPLLGEAWERPVSLAGIALCAAVSLALGNASVYLLLTRARKLVAAPLILCCALPALIGGATYLHALLIFLAVI